MMTRRKKHSVLVTGLILAWGCGFYAWAQIPRSQDETEELKREIRLLNLVNGLELTPAQMSLILSRAGGIKALRENFEESYRSRQAELENILKEIRSYLRENKEIPEEIARRFHALELEQKKARLELDERTQAYAREIEKSLEPHQIYQLERYVPCIIPPKGERRIGQAIDYKGFVRKLERIRDIPDRLYEQRKEIICQRTVDEIKLRAGRVPGFDETEISKKIGPYFDRVRSLSATDFEIQKENLAEEFISITKPRKPSPDLNRKIEAFLLAPEIISVLEEMSPSRTIQNQ